MKPYRFPDYQVAGHGPVTIFLLHGAYGSKDYFRPEIETLVNHGYRVVAWDAPGYGLSPLPVDGLSIEGLAEAATRLIQATAGATNVVVGHSMGGIAAPLVVNLLPRTCHGLVISATVASFSQKSEEDKKTFLAERITPLEQGKPFVEAAMPVIDSMFAKGSAGPLVDLVRSVAASTKKETFVAAIRAITNWDGEANLRQVKVPTLLVAGAEDKVGRPAGMENIRNRFIPHAEYVCIEGAGHYSFAEQPETFNRHLIGFLKKHFG